MSENSDQYIVYVDINNIDPYYVIYRVGKFVF